MRSGTLESKSPSTGAGQGASMRRLLLKAATQRSRFSRGGWMLDPLHCCRPQAVVRRPVILGQLQLSVRRSFTRAKCFVLFVINVRPAASACAAISVSNPPIGVPLAARDAATVPKRSAAAWSNDSTEMEPMNVSMRR